MGILSAMEPGWILADALRMNRRPAAEGRAGYRIFVRDLVLPCSIGIYDHEREGLQRVRVNALVLLDREAGSDIRNVYNYEDIVEGVRALAGAGHIELVEVMAARILDLCFADSRVESAWVSVEKLEAYAETESVGTILERHRRGVRERP